MLELLIGLIQLPFALIGVVLSVVFALLGAVLSVLGAFVGLVWNMVSVGLVLALIVWLVAMLFRHTRAVAL